MENELPEPPRGGPFALSKYGLLEEMIGKAGLTVSGGDSVPLDFQFSNVDQFWLVMRSSGATKAMIWAVGEDKIRNAAFSAVEQFVQPSGNVLIKNAFRFVTARP